MTELVRSEEHDEDFGIAFLANSPLRLDQFDAELGEVYGVAKASLSAQGIPETATPSNPAIIYVGMKGVAPTKVVSAGADHTPDPEWFPKTQPTEKTFQSVARKAAQNGVLSPDEIQIALRGLLLKAEI